MRINRDWILGMLSISLHHHINVSCQFCGYQEPSANSDLVTVFYRIWISNFANDKLIAPLDFFHILRNAKWIFFWKKWRQQMSGLSKQWHFPRVRNEDDGKTGLEEVEKKSPVLVFIGRFGLKSMWRVGEEFVRVYERVLHFARSTSHPSCTWHIVPHAYVLVPVLVT